MGGLSRLGWVECSFILDLSVCRPKDSSSMEIQDGEISVEGQCRKFVDLQETMYSMRK